jgi:hypothetical protein
MLGNNFQIILKHKNPLHLVPILEEHSPVSDGKEMASRAQIKPSQGLLEGAGSPKGHSWPGHQPCPREHPGLVLQCSSTPPASAPLQVYWGPVLSSETHLSLPGVDICHSSRRNEPCLGRGRAGWFLSFPAMGVRKGKSRGRGLDHPG